MNITKIASLLILLLLSLEGFAQKSIDELPEPPRDGKCYAVSRKAKEYRIVEKEVEVKPSEIIEEFIPAKYDTVIERVLVQEAYTELVTVDAVFDTTQQVRLVQDGAWVTVESYELEQEDKKIPNKKDGRWEVGESDYCVGGNCQTVRWVENTPKGIENAKPVLKEVRTEGRLKEKYATLPYISVKERARVVEVFVPARYKEIERKVLVAHAKKRQIAVPAEYKLVKSKELVKESDGIAWVEIVCPDMLSENVVKQVQLALMLRNYPVGAVNGKLGDGTLTALFSYQEENGLPIGNLDRDTIEALGFNYDIFTAAIVMANEDKHP